MKNISNGVSSLKSKVDKLDIEKLETTPLYLSKLSNVVKYDVATKTEYNSKIKKYWRWNILKDLATKTTLNAKINEVKG